MQTGQLNKIQGPAVFRFGQDNRPYATVQMKAADGTRWVDVKMLADSGNDITLIMKSVAQQLGLTPAMAAKHFTVEGVVPGQRRNFDLYEIPVRVGGYQPITVTVGVGDINQNLMGRDDFFQQFDITFDHNRTVIFRQAGRTRT